MRKKILGLITARGGSKGLPGKNIIEVSGKPLIAWTIEEALKSKFIDRLVLSSDDEEIIRVAKKWGCEVPFIRPDCLASDTSSTMDVVLHALEYFPDFQYVLLLQPTSPLRTSNHIDEAYSMMIKKNASSCISVCEVEQSPYWMYRIEKDLTLSKLIELDGGLTYRRQSLPPVYIPNGAIYIADIDWLRKTKNFFGSNTLAYVMPKNVSIDIDTKDDLEDFESFLKLNS